MTLFSIVIPTHNRPKLLKRLLESLERQTLAQEHFEVIVVPTENDPGFGIVNDCPWALSIQAEHPTVDPSSGRSASIKRNFGSEKAKGQWIGFIDDDCIAHPDWLLRAKELADKKLYGAIEGYTHIPEPERKTLTYKGICRLGRPGGYQTCNMFYRREDFIELQGFDPNFPFYLEDTDLAWTFLENGRQIAYGSEVIVEHPVPPAQPSRLMDNALRMIKLPYLYSKHPQTFSESNMRGLPRPYAIFLIFDIMVLASAIFWGAGWLLGGLLGRFALTFVYLLRLFWGCHWSWPEVIATYKYSLICPWISIVQLMKGNIKHRTFLLMR